VSLWPVLCALAVAAVVALVVVAVVLSARRERRRREALRLWATRHEWTYAESPPTDWARRLPGGNRRGVSLVLSGMHDTYPVSVAEYHYSTTSTSTSSNADGTSSTSTSTTTHRFIVVVVRLSQPGPAVEVQPRHALSKLGRAMFGDKPTAIGYEPFDRAFRILTKDPAAGRYLVGPALASAHVAGQVPPWSLYGTELMTYQPGHLRDPARIPDLVAPAIRIANLLGR
jgi:hypothetical protein